MNIKDYYFVADLLHEHSGLVLGEDKAYLVQSRLATVMRKWTFADLEVLVATLRHEPPEDLIADVVESMVTTDTFFFRDKSPFDHFRQVDLPGLLSQRQQGRAPRLWSAGCASGQEAYSLAMIVSETCADEDKVEILATDLSRQCLAKASSGIYTQFEVQRGLPITSLLAHFHQVGDKWQIDEGLQRMITFEHFNLLSSFEELPTDFDAVFCRNVLKFFDRLTRARILEAIADRLVPEGRLYLGHEEIAEGLTDRLVALPTAHGVYAPVSEQRHSTGPADQPAMGLAS
jgi:chemotaxis protein methyltransferase CheR